MTAVLLTDNLSPADTDGKTTCTPTARPDAAYHANELRAEYFAPIDSWHILATKRHPAHHILARAGAVWDGPQQIWLFQGEALPAEIVALFDPDRPWNRAERVIEGHGMSAGFYPVLGHWQIEGRTYPHRATLKAAGAQWRWDEKVWRFTGEDLPEAITDLLDEPEPSCRLAGSGMVAAYYAEDGRWIVSGETRPHMRTLRAVGGAWDRARKAWVIEGLGQDLPLELVALLVEPAAVAGEGAIEARLFGETWVVDGATRPHMRTLRKAGGTWNRSLKAWTFEGDLDQAVRDLLAPAGDMAAALVPAAA